jgi:tRNA threonylcarbamoyladenosine biosynthesis protein TsaB
MTRYSREVYKPLTQNARLLLIDTCGETAGVVLVSGEELVAGEDLARGSASAEIVQGISRLLQNQTSWKLRDLDAIGVVSGPGSFTGTRAGLATAKGLCEAANIPLAAVSRLEVLADAASSKDGYAALDAGRGEVYVREVETGREWLSTTNDLRVQCQGQRIVVAEARLLSELEGCDTILRPLYARDSLVAVLRRLREGGSDVALADANYVRGESDIYRRPAGDPK